MAWVISIREVKHVGVFVEEDRRSDTGRTPGVVHVKLSETFLPRDCWNRLLQAPLILPTQRGAGPCGTLARATFPTRLLWSIAHLIEPLRAHYMGDVAPRQGPRSRRFA